MAGLQRASANYPVAYVQGQTTTLTVTLALSPAPTIPINNVTITGQAPGLGNCIASNQTFPTQPTYTFSCTMSAALPANQTKFYNPLVINWSYTIGTTTNLIGATSNQVYVTLAAPLQQTVYRTVMNLAVSKDGAATPAAALTNSWSFFGDGTKPLNVTRWDGLPLTYYPAGVGFQACALTDADLLTSGIGRCGSFGELMQDVLATNGIASMIVEVKPAVDRGMLIKNWTFSQSPSFPGTQYPYKFIYPNEMVPVPPGNAYYDMTSDPGVPGQNSPTPSEKAHINHAILLPSISTTYYDPSYGLTYTGPDNFEDKAVDGYFSQFVGDPAYISRVRPSAGLHLIIFNPPPQ